MRRPARTTSRCTLCDYTTVIVCGDDESDAEFFARRDEEAVRLATHVRAEHPDVRGPFAIGRVDRDL